MYLMNQLEEQLLKNLSKLLLTENLISLTEDYCNLSTKEISEKNENSENSEKNENLKIF